ncbi:uncharacterized protein LOC122953592 [Acropora millepora]|uniref:uncharacterized protein LOC122953592 n=1 Tax=Acropora millepora TaxID=45264 RepID=UPI001CF18769|nr:uncharacterized protein LOC122953592 [Acropora millepora]
MSRNPDEPKPLAIRGCRNRAEAMQDVIQWEKKTSGREEDDPKTKEELAHVLGKLESLGGDRDAVLLLERDDAKELEVTVLTTARMRPTPLAIRGSRDPVNAATDIMNWVKESRRRENNNPSFDEVSSLLEKWNSLQGRDAVLFVERNDAMGLQVTVLTPMRGF